MHTYKVAIEFTEGFTTEDKMRYERTYTMTQIFHAYNVQELFDKIDSFMQIDKLILEYCYFIVDSI